MVHLTTREKYNLLYKNGYPHGGIGAPITWANMHDRNLRVLDVGCGWGLLSQRYNNYIGIDASDYVIEKNREKYGDLFMSMEISDIPQTIGVFDVVMALDVLEHITPDDLEKSLEALSNINTKEYLFSICCRDSGFRDENGGTLHPSLHCMDDWLAILKRHFTIIRQSEKNKQQTFFVIAE